MFNISRIVATSPNDEPVPKKTTSEVLSTAIDRGIQGGMAGAAAMTINVLTMMWLRTTINYQYRYGTTTGQALKTLYKDGGIPRFYRGLIPALAQGPLSRFGDTAANTGMLALFDHMDELKDLPVAVKTISASVAAASFRIFLMPIDTVKTTMQVEGKDALKKLGEKFRVNGPKTFYQGAIAASGATFAGHYPWFATNNYLEQRLPYKNTDDYKIKLVRRAFIGFASSFISDCCSNSIRVIKVYKQASTVQVTYLDAAKSVIASDGWIGLFGRGLKTKIIANGCQGIMFSVLWKYIDEQWFKKN
jgi:hypothetical protein